MVETVGLTWGILTGILAEGKVGIDVYGVVVALVILLNWCL